MLFVPLALAAGLEAPADRLAHLIDDKDLDERGLVTLARTAPTLAWQLRDPASRAALEVVLAMPPAEIRNVRMGQSAVRDPGEWGAAEGAAIDRLARLLGAKPGKLTHLRVHTVDNAVVRVDLELPKSTVGVGIAWPADWATGGVAADLREWLGVDVRTGASLLQEPSFENPLQLGFGWVADPAEAATLDAKRVAKGATSLRIQGPKAVVRQRLDLPAGGWLLTGSAAADGATLTVVVGGAKTVIDTAGWHPFELQLPGPASLIELRVDGNGGVNVDDLVLRSKEAEVAATGWITRMSNGVVVHADPARGAPPDAEAEWIDTALRSGLGRISVPVAGTVDVWLATDAQRSAGASLGVPTREDVGAGLCLTEPGSVWAAACPLRVMLTRAWGPAGNELMGAGLPRALAGSGVDLGHVRVADVPPLTTMTGHEVAAASFAGWLLEGQSLAAARAAWQATDLGAYRVSGKDLGALEAEWRATVGR